MSDILDRVKAECVASDDDCSDCVLYTQNRCPCSSAPCEWDIPAIRTALSAPANDGCEDRQ